MENKSKLKISTQGLQVLIGCDNIGVEGSY